MIAEMEDDSILCWVSNINPENFNDSHHKVHLFDLHLDFNIDFFAEVIANNYKYNKQGHNIF